MTALEVFTQSDGEVTKAYYRQLEKLGPVGLVAMNLFRAQKTSTRAKAYRGRQFKDRAYEVKNWSMGQLCDILLIHAESLGIVWGWKRDPKAYDHEMVMYIELPNGIGQVSFHSATKIKGPDFQGDWDGHYLSKERILFFCDQVMSAPDARQEVLAL